jgi:hypothetical protein
VVENKETKKPGHAAEGLRTVVIIQHYVSVMGVTTVKSDQDFQRMVVFPIRYL